MRARATLISSAPGFISARRLASISPVVSGARAHAIRTVSHSGSMLSRSAKGKTVSAGAGSATGSWLRRLGDHAVHLLLAGDGPSCVRRTGPSHHVRLHDRPT